ncbi:hypothetical protein TNCV_3159691 [Trichonephila clavipes]|nr:hypothetical protein TNCV_3159691 [Trichonephila clavipes]
MGEQTKKAIPKRIRCSTGEMGSVGFSGTTPPSRAVQPEVAFGLQAFSNAASFTSVRAILMVAPSSGGSRHQILTLKFLIQALVGYSEMHGYAQQRAEKDKSDNLSIAKVGGRPNVSQEATCNVIFFAMTNGAECRDTSLLLPDSKEKRKDRKTMLFQVFHFRRTPLSRPSFPPPTILMEINSVAEGEHAQIAFSGDRLATFWAKAKSPNRLTKRISPQSSQTRSCHKKTSNSPLTDISPDTRVRLARRDSARPGVIRKGGAPWYLSEPFYWKNKKRELLFLRRRRSQKRLRYGVASMSGKRNKKSLSSRFDPRS